MKEVFAFIIYAAIGMGVTVAYNERHGKDTPTSEMFVIGSLLWPAMVAADVYRAILPAPEKTGEAA